MADFLVILLLLTCGTQRDAFAHNTKTNGSTSNALVPVHLTCEYLSNPLGIETASPRFSWLLSSQQRAQLQTRYQILVASSSEVLQKNVGDKWDSGEVNSDQMLHVEYRGRPLSSGEACFWKVRAWDANGTPSRYSEPARFEMGLLAKSDWKARWISRNFPSDPKFVTGRIGKAIELNGTTQSIQVEHNKTIRFRNQLTMSAWIKTSHVPEKWSSLIRVNHFKTPRVLAIGSENNAFHIWFGVGAGGNYKELDAKVESKQIANNEWHLITGVYDGKECRIHLDGKSLLTEKHEGNVDMRGAVPTFIGSLDNDREFFHGAIDDARVYNRALSTEEVQDLYENRNSDALAKGLLQHWTFDDRISGEFTGQTGWWIDGGISAAPLMRKEFKIAKPIRTARAYISGLGYSELYINGKKISDHVLSPASSNYFLDPKFKLKDRVHYVTHDITEQVKQGTNAAGVMLGNGWFSDDTATHYGRYPWRPRPQLRMQIAIKYVDGTDELVTTDETWSTADSPIKANEICAGETYDARDELPNWSHPGFDDSKWANASIAGDLSQNMTAETMAPCRIVASIPPISVTEMKPGTWIFDFGQHFSGWTRLKVRGPRGTKVTLRHAGTLYPDGNLDLRANLNAPLIDNYILKGGSNGKGDEDEIWEPRFTLHGFRYIELTGYPGKPTLKTLIGKHVRNDVPISSEFETSNPLINQVYKNHIWTLATSFQHLPQDAAERDERVGWQGDTGFVAQDYMTNFDAAPFWANWLRDIQDVQREDGDVPVVAPLHRGFPPNAEFTRQYYQAPDWTCTYPLFVSYLHLYHGDIRLIEQHYDNLARLIAYYQTKAKDDLLPTDLGDHMEPQLDGSSSFKPKISNSTLTTTCYYYRVVRIMEEFATKLKKDADAEKYHALAARIKKAFNEKYFDHKTKNYGTGSQAENSVPLEMDIVPEEHRNAVLENIVHNIQTVYKGHLGTGIIGTTSLATVLPKMGRSDVMYNIAAQKTFPGWGHQIDRGATTVWETWNGEPGRNWNMKMFASGAKFFIKNLGGIQPAAPGYKKAIIKPDVVGDLTHVRAAQTTASGRFSSEWTADKDNRIKTLNVSIPTGTTATVFIPVKNDSTIVKEGGKTVWEKRKFVSGTAGISSASTIEGRIALETGSGDYRFSVEQ